VPSSPSIRAAAAFARSSAAATTASPASTARRTCAGSRLGVKTFAYLAAIASKRATPATSCSTPRSASTSATTTWAPHNYDEQYRGRVTLREAFEKSLNVPTVR